jgi:predicted ATPase
MIKELQLKNFKSWRDSGPVQLAPVTMLLGPNSSGKSTLLQSLLLLKQTIASPDRTIHLNLGGDEANDFFNFGEFENVLTHGTGTPRQFEIALSFQRPVGERVQQGRFTCSYGKTSAGSVAIQELTLASVARRIRAVRRDRGTYLIMVDDETQSRAKGRHMAPERSIALPADAIVALGKDGGHVQDLSLAIRRELEDIAYLGPLRRKPERDYVWNKTKPGEVGIDGHKVMEALLASALLKSDDQRQTLDGVSKWLRMMGVADQIEVRQVGRSSRYELVIHKDGVMANLRDVGIGVSQVLPVLTLAYFVPRGSTVLLEEPEIHLHPLAQSVLAEMFVEVSQTRGVQFVVETHSEHLFRRMQTLIARGQTDTNKCQMMFVERQGADAVLRKLDVDDFGTVKNWPTNFFGDSVGEAREQARARADRMRKAVHV